MRDDLDVVLLVVNARERIGAGDKFVARRVFALGSAGRDRAQQGRPAASIAQIADADEDGRGDSATSTRSIP